MEQEYELSDNTVIISTSDRQGNILTYNAAFLEASGYSDDEIIGKPHSLLRHPDMPSAAFKDLWQTIEAGRPWFGMVKNKRKNGDYYWVAANVSPIFEGGQIKGYVSVRYPASVEQKQMANALYAKVTKGRATLPWTKTRPMHLWQFLGVLCLLLIGAFLDVIGSLSWLSASLTLLGTAWGLLLFVQASKPNRVQQQAIEDLANGRFRNKIMGNDPWTNNLNLLRTRIGQSASEVMDAARESAILTTALNATSTNIMVVDHRMHIVSLNASLTAMFRHNESALRTLLPHFSVQSLIGTHLNSFCYDSKDGQFIPQDLNQPWTKDVVASDAHLGLLVMPIIRESRRLGYVIEWFDRTQELLIERRISGALDSLASGHFDSRVEVTGLSGFNLTLANDINRAISTLSTAVTEVVKTAQSLSRGDLTVKVQGSYQGDLAQIKQAMNQAIRSLNDSFSHVQVQAAEVADASTKVEQANLGLSDRIQSQASAIEQTSATMSTLTDQVQQSAAAAQGAAQLVSASAQEVRSGVVVMRHAIDAINEISAVSHQITGIVALIDSIAFQTNLLALNAAVEAARAGEHGRGFAVVASEVRALAGKSADAAKDIKDLVDETALRIHVGTEKVQESGAMLDAVLGHFDQMVSLVKEISQSAGAQAVGLKETNVAIIEIDDAVQQGAGLVQDNTSLAQYLGEVAHSLDALVSRFKLKTS